MMNLNTMKTLAIAGLAMLPFAGKSQQMNKHLVRIGDTVAGAHGATRGVWYKQNSKWGVRVELAESFYRYKGSTGDWLGRHFAFTPGIQIVYSNIFIGARISRATVMPNTYYGNGNALTTITELKPIKYEYSVGYVVNLEKYLTLEPFAALTFNKFTVVEDVNASGVSTPAIPVVAGLTTGIGLNYYFKFRHGQLICLYSRYAHGFSNYRKISQDLDSGYNELTTGIAYKGFFQKKIFKRVVSTSPKANGGL